MELYDLVNDLSETTDVSGDHLEEYSIWTRPTFLDHPVDTSHHIQIKSLSFSILNFILFIIMHHGLQTTPDTLYACI